MRGEDEGDTYHSVNACPAYPCTFSWGACWSVRESGGKGIRDLIILKKHAKEDQTVLFFKGAECFLVRFFFRSFKNLFNRI